MAMETLSAEGRNKTHNFANDIEKDIPDIFPDLDSEISENSLTIKSPLLAISSFSSEIIPVSGNAKGKLLFHSDSADSDITISSSYEIPLSSNLEFEECSQEAIIHKISKLTNCCMEDNTKESHSGEKCTSTTSKDRYILANSETHFLNESDTVNPETKFREKGGLWMGSHSSLNVSDVGRSTILERNSSNLKLEPNSQYVENNFSDNNVCNNEKYFCEMNYRFSDNSLIDSNSNQNKSNNIVKLECRTDFKEMENCFTNTLNTVFDPHIESYEINFRVNCSGNENLTQRNSNSLFEKSPKNVENLDNFSENNFESLQNGLETSHNSPNEYKTSFYECNKSDMSNSILDDDYGVETCVDSDPESEILTDSDFWNKISRNSSSSSSSNKTYLICRNMYVNEPETYVSCINNSSTESISNANTSKTNLESKLYMGYNSVVPHVSSETTDTSSNEYRNHMLPFSDNSKSSINNTETLENNSGVKSLNSMLSEMECFGTNQHKNIIFKKNVNDNVNCKPDNAEYFKVDKTIELQCKENAERSLLDASKGVSRTEFDNTVNNEVPILSKNGNPTLCSKWQRCVDEKVGYKMEVLEKLNKNETDKIGWRKNKDIVDTSKIIHNKNKVQVEPGVPCEDVVGKIISNYRALSTDSKSYLKIGTCTSEKKGNIDKVISVSELNKASPYEDKNNSFGKNEKIGGGNNDHGLGLRENEERSYPKRAEIEEEKCHSITIKENSFQCENNWKISSVENTNRKNNTIEKELSIPLEFAEAVEHYSAPINSNKYRDNFSKVLKDLEGRSTRTQSKGACNSSSKINCHFITNAKENETVENGKNEKPVSPCEKINSNSLEYSVTGDMPSKYFSKNAKISVCNNREFGRINEHSKKIEDSCDINKNNHFVHNEDNVNSEKIKNCSVILEPPELFKDKRPLSSKDESISSNINLGTLFPVLKTSSETPEIHTTFESYCKKNILYSPDSNNNNLHESQSHSKYGVIRISPLEHDGAFCIAIEGITKYNDEKEQEDSITENRMNREKTNCKDLKKESSYVKPYQLEPKNVGENENLVYYVEDNMEIAPNCSGENNTLFENLVTLNRESVNNCGDLTDRLIVQNCKKSVSLDEENIQILFKTTEFESTQIADKNNSQSGYEENNGVGIVEESIVLKDEEDVCNVMKRDGEASNDSYRVPSNSSENIIRDLYLSKDLLKPSEPANLRIPKSFDDFSGPERTEDKQNSLEEDNNLVPSENDVWKEIEYDVQLFGNGKSSVRSTETSRFGASHGDKNVLTKRADVTCGRNSVLSNDAPYQWLYFRIAHELTQNKMYSLSSCKLNLQGPVPLYDLCFQSVQAHTSCDLYTDSTFVFKQCNDVKWFDASCFKNPKNGRNKISNFNACVKLFCVDDLKNENFNSEIITKLVTNGLNKKISNFQSSDKLQVNSFLILFCCKCSSDLNNNINSENLLHCCNVTENEKYNKYITNNDNSFNFKNSSECGFIDKGNDICLENENLNNHVVNASFNIWNDHKRISITSIDAIKKFSDYFNKSLETDSRLREGILDLNLDIGFGELQNTNFKYLENETQFVGDARNIDSKNNSYTENDSNFDPSKPLEQCGITNEDRLTDLIIEDLKNCANSFNITSSLRSNLDNTCVQNESGENYKCRDKNVPDLEDMKSKSKKYKAGNSENPGTNMAEHGGESCDKPSILKSALKRSGSTNKKPNKKKHRVQFNENLNKSFEADYVILVRDDDYDDDDFIPCDCGNQFCYDGCYYVDEDEPEESVDFEPSDERPKLDFSSPFDPPLDFVDHLTLSPPDGYKDSCCHAPLGFKVSASTMTSDENNQTEETVGNDENDNLSGEVLDLRTDLSARGHQRQYPLTGENNKDQNENNQQNETINSEISNRLVTSDCKSANEISTMDTSDMTKSEEASGSFTMPDIMSCMPQNTEMARPTVGGILKGGKCWTKTHDGNDSEVECKENRVEDEEKSNECLASASKKGVTFDHNENNSCNLCESANEIRDDKCPSNTEYYVSFKIGSRVIPTNSLKPNSAVRQLFPDSKFIPPPGSIEGDDNLGKCEGKYLVTEESLRAFNEVNRRSLHSPVKGKEIYPYKGKEDGSYTANSDDEDMLQNDLIKKTIERNTLRRSLMRYPKGDHRRRERTKSKSDISLEERIKQLTMVDEDEIDNKTVEGKELVTNCENEKQIDQDKNVETESKIDENIKTEKGNSSTYKKFTDLVTRKTDAVFSNTTEQYYPYYQPVHNPSHPLDLASDLNALDNHLIPMKGKLNTNESRKQFLSSLVPLTACVSRHNKPNTSSRETLKLTLPARDRSSITSAASSTGTEYSIGDIDEVLNNPFGGNSNICGPQPDIVAGTPNGNNTESNAQDELAMFVQQDANRIARIRKRYSSAPSSAGSDDDEHDDYGFNRRPSVRGIKPRFCSTNEILLQMQSQLQPPPLACPGRVGSHISWPYYSTECPENKPNGPCSRSNLQVQQENITYTSNDVCKVTLTACGTLSHGKEMYSTHVTPSISVGGPVTTNQVFRPTPCASPCTGVSVPYKSNFVTDHSLCMNANQPCARRIGPNNIVIPASQIRIPIQPVDTLSSNAIPTGSASVIQKTFVGHGKHQTFAVPCPVGGPVQVHLLATHRLKTPQFRNTAIPASNYPQNHQLLVARGTQTNNVPTQNHYQNTDNTLGKSATFVSDSIYKTVHITYNNIGLSHQNSPVPSINSSPTRMIPQNQLAERGIPEGASSSPSFPQDSAASQASGSSSLLKSEICTDSNHVTQTQNKSTSTLLYGMKV